MPLSSFLLKPMQRITRYPLLIKNVSLECCGCLFNRSTRQSPFFYRTVCPGQILEHTPEGHADRGPLRDALERAEELCSQVNEGVREKENSDRLEWIQAHIQCEGPIEVNVRLRLLPPEAAEAFRPRSHLSVALALSSSTWSSAR